MSNVSQQPGTVVRRVDIREQLAIYDALPKRWRELVDALPIPQDTKRVAEVLAARGEVAGYEFLVQVFRQKFPLWTPP